MSRSFTSSHTYPTLYQVLFSPHTPYVPPKASPFAMFAWRRRIWIECTFGLVGMEPWEKYLFVAFLIIVFGCIAHAGIVAYRMLPPAILGFKPMVDFHHGTTTIRNITFPVS